MYAQIKMEKFVMSNGEILSAFGEHVNNPTLPEVSISCVYGIIDDRHETFSATGGAATTNDAGIVWTENK
jgi:hypothetical protein